MTEDYSFYPFDAALMRSDNDFSIDDLASYLELNNLQKRLLMRWLQDLKLNLWFTHDDDGANPRLTINVFAYKHFVADVNLLRLLKGISLEFSQIGDAPEIQALEELKAATEAAITARKPGIEGGQQEENAEE